MQRHTAWLVVALIIIALGVPSCRNGRGGGETFIEKAVSDSLDCGATRAALSLIDSVMPSVTDSDTYISLRVFQAFGQYYCSQPDSVTALLDEAERYLDSRPDALTRRQLEIMTRMQMARGAMMVQYAYDPDSAVRCYRKALQAAAPDDYETRMRALGNMADAYTNSGHLDLALDSYDRARELSDSIGQDPSKRVQLTMGTMAVLTELRDFDNQQPLIEDMEKILPGLPRHDVFNYLTALSNSHYYRQDYRGSERALARLDSSLAAQSEAEWERNFNRVNMADVQLRLGHNDEAEALIDSTELYFTHTQPNPYVMDYIRTLRLRHDIATGHNDRVDEALLNYGEALTDRPQQRLAAYDLRREYYASTGQWAKAFRYQSLYDALDDSLRNERVRMYNHTLRLRNERDSQVRGLREDVERHRQRSRTVTIVVCFSVALVVLLVVLLVLTRRLARSREADMRRKLIELRMQSARTRINPHFIYNAINHALANDGTSHERLVRLVRLMRRQQVIADRWVDSLADEVDFVNDYVAIQREGMANPLEYGVTIGEGVEPAEVMLPSMVLQIFVENAFKHGFRSLPQGVARLLDIRVSVVGSDYVAEVCNNSAHDPAPSPDSTRVGLRIVSATLQMLNEGQPQPITFGLGPWADNPQGAGCKATLTIPVGFRYKDNHINGDI